MLSQNQFMRDLYPLPIDMKVRDFGPDDLEIHCPACRQVRFKTGFSLSLELPGEMPVIDYVTRHVCQQCSRPGHKVRCVGFVRPYPRSGAEGERPDLIPF